MSAPLTNRIINVFTQPALWLAAAVLLADGLAWSGPLSHGTPRWALVLIVIQAALLITAVLFVVMRRFDDQRRLATMTEACGLIGSGQLDTRLPVSARGDHADELAEELNKVFSRFGGLVESRMNQADYIDHEFGRSAGNLLACVHQIRSMRRDRSGLEATVDKMERECKNILKMTEGISTLMNGSQISSRTQALDLSLLVSDAVDILEGRAEDKGIRLEASLSPTYVLGEPMRLTMMIQNLIENALKYTPAGGAVLIRCGLSDGVPRLIVDDSGPGIPENMRAEIMKPRRRLESSENGKGLGLAIVEAMADSHLARVQIGAADMGGARFEVIFLADRQDLRA